MSNRWVGIDPMENEWREVESYHRRVEFFKKEAALKAYDEATKDFDAVLLKLKGSVRDPQCVYEHGLRFERVIADLVQESIKAEAISSYVDLMKASSAFVKEACVEVCGDVTKDKLSSMEKAKNDFVHLADKVTQKLAPDWRDKVCGAVMVFAGVVVAAMTLFSYTNVVTQGYRLFDGYNAKAIQNFKTALLDRETQVSSSPRKWGSP